MSDKSKTVWQKIKGITYNIFVWFHVVIALFLIPCDVLTTIDILFEDPLRKFYFGGEAFPWWNYESPQMYLLSSYLRQYEILLFVCLVLKFRKSHPKCVWIGILLLYLYNLGMFFLG